MMFGLTPVEQAIWEAVVILGVVTAFLAAQRYFHRPRYLRGRRGRR